MREYPAKLFEVKVENGKELIRWIGGGIYSTWYEVASEYSLLEWLKKLRNIMRASGSPVNEYKEEFVYWHGSQCRNLLTQYHYFATWNQEREAWSREQFGTSAERSAVGPAKHMVKECKELIESVEKGDTEHAKGEAVDMLFLAFDVCQRLNMEIEEITRRACEKLEINKNREWPKTSANEPVEHKREPH